MAADDPLSIDEPLGPDEWDAIVFSCERLAPSTVLVVGRVRNLPEVERRLLVAIDVVDRSGAAVGSEVIDAGIVTARLPKEFRGYIAVRSGSGPVRCEISEAGEVPL